MTAPSATELPTAQPNVPANSRHPGPRAVPSVSSVLILPPGPIVDRHRRPQERLQAARRPPAYPNQARIIAPVTPSHPSAVLTPSTCMNRWIRANPKPVTSLIYSRIGVTLELGLLAIAIGLLMALPVGIYSAIRQDTISDYIGRTVAILGLATPNFWLATMVLIYPAIWWGWSPTIEPIPFLEDPLGNLWQFSFPARFWVRLWQQPQCG